jgi:hypothetical protein
VEADHGISKIRVESHTRRKGDGHVGEQTHAESSQSGDGSCCGDQVPLDLLDALQVDQWRVREAVILALGRADAVTTRVGNNGGLQILAGVLGCILEKTYS